MTEPEKPGKPGWKLRSIWLFLYAVLSAVEFVVCSAKEMLEEMIKGKEHDDEPRP